MSLSFRYSTLSLGLTTIFVITLLMAMANSTHAQPNPSHTVKIAGDNTTTAPIFHENVVTFWDDVALDAIRQSRPGPPVVARTLALVHTAQYEAWSQYDAAAVGTLLGARFRQPAGTFTGIDKSTAMSYAAYRVLVDLFPDLEWFFSMRMQEHELDPAITTTDPTVPAGLGNLAAAIVLTYRHDDGANQLGDRHPGAYSDYTGYQPVNTPNTVVDLNHWQPLQTPNGSFQGGCFGGGELITQTYVAPHWGNVLPFALNDGEVLTPTVGPARYPSAAFTLQAQELISISAHLTDREKMIAEYWADGPASELPPGHWALIAQYVSFRDQHTLDDDAKLFFALSNANLDAGILAWKLKRIYDSVRPVTAIRELFRGQAIQAWGGPFAGTVTLDGSQWQPYQESCFVTPAFPEYISGHSTFSAASAEILKQFTGSDNFGNEVTISYSRIEPTSVAAQPVTLHWATFTDAANEAAMSRRYGGIHFADGDLQGRALGRQVGTRAWTKALTFWDGTATPVAALDEQITAIVAVDNYDRVFLPYAIFLPLVHTGAPVFP